MQNPAPRPQSLNRQPPDRAPLAVEACLNRCGLWFAGYAFGRLGNIPQGGLRRRNERPRYLPAIFRKEVFMSLEIYLIRHGQTLFNTTGRLQGWSDSPLTQAGREVAARLGRGLSEKNVRFDAAFSSTAPRAAQTAQLILAQSGQADLPLVQLDDLREYCFGGFEGEFRDVVFAKVAAAAGMEAAEWARAYRSARTHLLAEAAAALDPLGLAETEAQLVGRLRRGLDEVMQRSAGFGRVMVVAHGMAITALLKSIDFDCIPYQSVDNASVSRLRFDGRWHVDSVGETGFWAQ